MSVLVRPEGIDPARWTWLPLLAGLAVSRWIRRTARDLPAVLKWPNDVLVGDRKVCGILAERVETPRGAACVVGHGDQRRPDRQTSCRCRRRPRWRLLVARVRRRASLAYGSDRQVLAALEPCTGGLAGAGGEWRRHSLPHIRAMPRRSVAPFAFERAAQRGGHRRPRRSGRQAPGQYRLQGARASVPVTSSTYSLRDCG